MEYQMNLNTDLKVGTATVGLSQVTPGLNLDDLRCDQSFNTTGAGSRQILTMGIHKAAKEEFVRVKPEASPLGPFGFVQLPGDREVWVVPNALATHLPGLVKPKTLHLAVTQTNAPFFIPAGVPDPSRPNRWIESQLEAIRKVHGVWGRIVAIQDRKAYEVFPGDPAIPEPVWPTETNDELLKLALKDRVVTDQGHPVFQKLLRGI
jgi:hypothetical protein